MPKIKIRFFYKDQIISFEYEESCTIEEMLKDFLRKTHSKMTLNPEEIIFIYRAKCLNNVKYLYKKLKHAFKAKEKSLISIKVIDYCGVVGCGNYYYIGFIFDEDNEITKRLFEYEESCTIKEMLEDFLRQTHSKMTLDPSKIYFLYQARILNIEEYLNKTLKEVFILNKNMPTIQVIDTSLVIG